MSKLRELLEKAAELLSQEAEALRECSTIGPEHDDWTGEEAAKHDHDEMIEVAAGLRNHAEAIVELIEAAEKMRDATNDATMYARLKDVNAALSALKD